MKKAFALIIAFMLALTCAYADEAEEWTAPEAGEALSLEKDLGVLVDDVFYPIKLPVDELVAALGEPDEIITSPSCVFVGEDKEFSYEYGSVYTDPIDGNDVWYEFYIFAEGMSTTRGISVGDEVEKMLEAYGENYYVEGEGMYTYSISGIEGDNGSPCIIFETEDGFITIIDIYYPTNI